MLLVNLEGVAITTECHYHVVNKVAKIQKRTNGYIIVDFSIRTIHKNREELLMYPYSSLKL